jgi:hypothetical protein
MAEVAACLNAEGFHPPKRVERFTGGMVAGLLARKYGQGSADQARGGRLRRGEWWLGDLARQLGMPLATLHRWRKAGWLVARKLVDGRWAVRATGPERRRLMRLRRHQQRRPNQAIPKELTTTQTTARK